MMESQDKFIQNDMSLFVREVREEDVREPSRRVCCARRLSGRVRSAGGTAAERAGEARGEVSATVGDGREK